jgi:glycosyltransferase involved in cell wall biosynthesis
MGGAVWTSIYRGFALGTPVISSSSGALPELVKNDVSGILCEPGCVRSLAEAIDRLSSGDELRSVLGAGARKFFLSEFTETVNYQKLIECYDLAIDTARRLSPT